MRFVSIVRKRAFSVSAVAYATQSNMSGCPKYLSFMAKIKCSGFGSIRVISGVAKKFIISSSMV